MSMENKKISRLTEHKMQLRILTPVHVGNGQSYNRLDYIYDPENQVLGILDQAKWLHFLLQKNLADEYINRIMAYSANQSRSVDGFNNYSWLDSKRMNKIMEQLVREGVVKQQIKLRDALSFNNQLMPFVRNGMGELYIPGSSIKGALRSAMMCGLIRRAYQADAVNKRQVESIWNELKLSVVDNRIDEKGAKRAVEKVNSLFFRPLRDRDDKVLNAILSDPFRAIRISDAICRGDAQTIIVQKIDLVHKQKIQDANRLSLWRECLEIGTELDFSITLDHHHLKACGLESWTTPDDLLVLVKEAREYLRNAYEKPLKEAIAKQSVSNGLQNHSMDIAGANMKPSETALFLGGGTGFVEKTLIYALAPTPEEASDLTREILMKKFPKYPKNKFAERNPVALKVYNIKKCEKISDKMPSAPYRRLGIVAIKSVQS